jgi:hypothetical protein
MTTYTDVMLVAGQLSMAEKIRLIEYLSATLRHDLEVEIYKQMSWHDFIEHTAGSLADSPIERPPQLPYEEREPLE